MKNKKILLSFIISFIYTCLGTLVVVTCFPKYEILGFNDNNPLWLPLTIITIPTNMLLFGLVMVDNSIISIIILQSLIFLLYWILIYQFLKDK